MSMFIYVCLCCVILAAPTVTLENENRLKCTENGECLEKGATNTDYEYDCHNNTNAAPGMCYIEVTNEFGNDTDMVSIVDIKHILLSLNEKYNTQDKIQREVAEVFQGIIVAVILFGVCACLCVVTACIYCCRMNITDNRLKSDVEALAEKLKRDCRFKKSVKKTPLKPVSESCNIIVEDAGIYVV